MFFLVYNSILSQKVSYKMGFNTVYHNNVNISTSKKQGLFNPNCRFVNDVLHIRKSV